MESKSSAKGTGGGRLKTAFAPYVAAALLVGALCGVFLQVADATSRACVLARLCSSADDFDWPRVSFSGQASDLELCGVFDVRIELSGDASGIEVFLAVIDTATGQLFLGPRPSPDKLPIGSRVGAWYRNGEYQPVAIMIRDSSLRKIAALAAASANPPLYGIEPTRGNDVAYAYDRIVVISNCPLPSVGP